MSSIYDKTDNAKIIARIHSLTPESNAVWGKMTYEHWDSLMLKHTNHHLKSLGFREILLLQLC